MLAERIYGAPTFVFQSISICWFALGHQVRLLFVGNAWDSPNMPGQADYHYSWSRHHARLSFTSMLRIR